MAEQRWQDFQLNKTQVFWLCAAALTATLIAGFGIAGWVTAARAKSMASKAAENARRDLAVAVCVHEFMDGRGAAARLAKLQGTELYRRPDLISTGGFATMPDRKEADDAVAAGCAAALDDAELPSGK